MSETDVEAASARLDRWRTSTPKTGALPMAHALLHLVDAERRDAAMLRTMLQGYYQLDVAEDVETEPDARRGLYYWCAAILDALLVGTLALFDEDKPAKGWEYLSVAVLASDLALYVAKTPTNADDVIAATRASFRDEALIRDAVARYSDPSGSVDSQLVKAAIYRIKEKAEFARLKRIRNQARAHLDLRTITGQVNDRTRLSNDDIESVLRILRPLVVDLCVLASTGKPDDAHDVSGVPRRTLAALQLPWCRLTLEGEDGQPVLDDSRA